VLHQHKQTQSNQSLKAYDNKQKQKKKKFDSNMEKKKQRKILCDNQKSIGFQPSQKNTLGSNQSLKPYNKKDKITKKKNLNQT
jgi:hypothetical protein